MGFGDLTVEDRERILAKAVIHFVMKLSPQGFAVKDETTNTNWVMFMNPDDDLEMLIEETFEISPGADCRPATIFVTEDLS
jgi:hypothetical protein